MNTFKLMNLKRCTGTTNFNTASMRHGAQPVTSATTAKETRWKPPHPCNSRSVINCASILGAFSLIWLFPFRSLSSCGTREDLGPISLTPSKTRVIFSPAYFDAVSIVRWIKFHFSLIPSPPLCLSFSHSSIFPKYSFIFLFFFKSLSWDYLQLFFNWIENSLTDVIGDSVCIRLKWPFSWFWWLSMSFSLKLIPLGCLIMEFKFPFAHAQSHNNRLWICTSSYLVHDW